MPGGSAGPFPFFFRQPIQYMRWAAHEKPALWFSVLIGGAGPLLILAGVPTRKYFGIERNPVPPYTYPVPTKPRQPLPDYDDP
ncbi:MAG: hypothetical protein M1828_001376 [Chrysothrix sp. TS-e1954]|nr:MAG: hypothetical protein M1828_001376 [Chrysothrix sp. TS-e1954]